MSELNKENQDWLEFIAEYTDEFGDVIETRFVKEKLLEMQQRITELEQENKFFIQGFTNATNGLDINFSLAQRDKQVAIKAIEGLQEQFESLSNAKVMRNTLIKYLEQLKGK